MPIPRFLQQRHLHCTVGWPDVSAKALGHFLDIDHERVSEIITGRCEKVRLVELIRIADVLRMTLDELKDRILTAKRLDQERRAAQITRLTSRLKAHASTTGLPPALND